MRGEKEGEESSSSPSSHKAGAIIAAAGTSQRMGELDKTFAPLAGKPLLAHVVDLFQSCPFIHQIVIVLKDESLPEGRKLVEKQNWTKVIEVCPGGLRRQDSVAEGLKSLENCDWVVVHDGARPCLTSDLISRGLTEALETGAAVAAIPVTDTIKVVGSKGIIENTLNRNKLWAIQTPQVFRIDIIKRAYHQVTVEATDDAALVEALGCKVKVYRGSYDNIKVTTPADLALAEVILRNRERETRDKEWNHPCSMFPSLGEQCG